MSLIGSRGVRGQDGADGSAAQSNGTAGMQGGDAAIVYTTLVDANQTKLIAKGGRGGRGGDGAASATVNGGNGGDGGQGAAASNTVLVASAPTLTNFEVTAYSIGGSGGDGGFRGSGAAGAPSALGGNGGDGGQGVASASVNVAYTMPPGGQVAVSVAVQGGSGGAAGFGAKGGAGATAQLDNAATAMTSNGSVEVFQSALGGKGGDARNLGSGGNGGDATSNLSLDDTKNPEAQQTAFYSDFISASGGNGGAGSTHQGSGGDATSIVDLTASMTADSGAQVTTQVTGGAAGAELAPSTGAAVSGGTADSEVTMHGANVTAMSTAYGGKGGDAVGPHATGGVGGAAHATAHVYGVISATAEVLVSAGDGGNGTQGAAGGAGTPTLIGDDALTVQAQPGGYVSLTGFALGSYGGSSDTGLGGNGGSGTDSLDHTDQQSIDLKVEANSAGGDGGKGGAGDGRGGDAAASATGTGGGQVYVDATALAGDSGGIGGNATATAVSSGVNTTSRGLVYGGSGQTSGSAICVATTTATTSGELNPNAFSYAPTGVVRDVGSYTTVSLTGTDTASASTQYGGRTPTAPAGAILAQAVGLPSAAQVAPILAANTNIAAALGSDPTVFVLGDLGSGHGALASGIEGTVSGITAVLQPSDLTSNGDLTLGLYGGLASTQGLQEVRLLVTKNSLILFQADIRSGDVGSQAAALFTDHEIDLATLGAGRNFTLSVELDVTTQAGGTFEGGIIVGQAPEAMSALVPDRFANTAHLLAGSTPSHPIFAMLHAV